ncbi:MAG TPA: hypothetical protein VFX76_08240 [Roseiflexaceae bacterium]|nr:hypothetical protein [Roseiflexaceae bacterium]
MRRFWAFACLALLAALTLLGGTASALAQQDQPPAAPQNLTMFTLYPAQELALGEDATLSLKLRGGTAPQLVRLSVENLPNGWTTTFRGERLSVSQPRSCKWGLARWPTGAWKPSRAACASGWAWPRYCSSAPS